MKSSDCFKLECFLSEEISGDIQLRAPCFQSMLWEGKGLKSFVTIRVQNSSKHPMYLIITNEKRHCILIYPNEERLLSVPNVKEIKVKCCDLDNDSYCLGNFTLCIHHPICTSICNNSGKSKEKWDSC